MERYKEYKDSGVKWLGEIPSHWEIVKLKRCAIIKTGTTPPTSNLKYFENGDIPWFTPGDINDMNLHFSSKTITKKAIKDNVGRLFPAESIYFVGIGATVGKVAACDFEASSNQQINAIMCNDRLDYKFATYCLLMEQGIIRETTNFVTLPILNQSSTGLIDIVLPPLPEQDSIVRYLDSATSEIDKAIAMQQKMIDLLNERKQIIIQNAVTKGLDENVEMKESGVEWIGRIPKHWEVSKLKYIIKEPLKYGANEASDYIDYSCPRYIRITDIDSNGKLKEDTFRSLPRDKAEPYLLSKGDILFARSGATVGKAFLFEEEYKACYAGYLIKASLDNKKALSKFVFLYTQTLAYQRWKESIFIQATIQNISGEKYSNMQIAIPPISEQKRIIDCLLPRLNGFDTAITNCQRQITLLQERKQIIINEVVTGKVRVS